MKIGLLGGSFNPAHQGHIHISEMAIKKLGLNQVWWIPTSQNPLKEKTTTPFAIRLEGCKKITENHPKIQIKNFEKDSISTYKLVKKIKAQWPEVQFYWIMGADNLEKFHLWKNFIPLIKLIEFAIFSRANFLQKAKATRAIQIYQGLTNIKNTKAKNERLNLQQKNSQARQCNLSRFSERSETGRRPNYIAAPENSSAVNLNKPKFLFFKTKNYDISSSEIRNNSR